MLTDSMSPGDEPRARLRGTKGARRSALALVAVLTAGVAASLTAPAAAAPPAGAQQPAEPGYTAVTVNSPDPQSNGRWAERTATAGDLDGDGVNDLWVGVPKAGGTGSVYALSGAALASGQSDVLYTIASPEPQDGKNFGFFISNLGDVNGDGTPDVAAGTDAQDTTADGESCDAEASSEPDGCNEGQGKAWVFSGSDGATLYAMNNPNPQGSDGNKGRFGSRTGRAGDVTGDGVPDVIAGASGADVCATDGCRQAVEEASQTEGTQASTGNLSCADVEPFPRGCRRDEGEAFIFDGTNGSLVRTLNMPAEDRVPETCSQRREDLPPEVGDNIASCGNMGLAVQGPGDVNGDGVLDQLVGAPTLTIDGEESVGRMYVFSGRDGSLLHKIDNPAPHERSSFGFQDVSPLSPGDVDNDGAADIYGVGFGQDGADGPEGAGRAWVFSGRTGDVIYEVDNPNLQYGGQFGWSMSREQSYYGPGRSGPRGPLYVGNAPHHTPPPCDSDNDGQVDPGKELGVNCQDQRGETNLVNFPRGQAIATLSLPAPWNQELGSFNISEFGGDLGPNLGWTVSTPGDLNGDGEPEYVAGAPFTNVGQNQNEGVLIVYVSGRG